MYQTEYPNILIQFTPNISPIITEPADNDITFANVGVNRIIKSPNEQNQQRHRTFEPIPLRRNNGPLIIYNKRWYFRLIAKKHGERRRARALMDDYNLNDIAHHMVVCFTPNKIPGNTRPFRNRDGSLIHIYAYFDSYLEFYDYIQNFQPDDRSFYEIIFGELPQKPHFDIDIGMNDLNNLYPDENINIVAETLREAVITGCIEVLQENMISMDISRDILLYSSHGKEKRSYHIVLNNKCHDGNKEAKAFYDAVMKKVSIYTNGKYLDFVDKSVYSPRQQFRMIGSQKQGSNRPKIFYEQFVYQGQQYTHIYSEDVTDITIKKLTILYESMVSFTSGCILLPSLIPPRPINHNNLSEMPDIDNKIVEQCMIMLRNKMDDCPFSVKEIHGHLILLKRHAPSHCPICRKAEPHENENPYMFIIGGKVYWDCRRSPDDSKKFFVGYLAMTLEEMQMGSTFLGNEITSEDNSGNEENDNQGEFMFGDYDIGLPTLLPLKRNLIKENTEYSIPELLSSSSALSSSSPALSSSSPALSPERRIQNVQANIMKIAQEWAKKKYIRQEPEDLIGIRSLASVTNEINNWKAGI